MRRFDFLIKYDPEKDTQRDIIKRIFYVLYIKRMKGNKPAVTFISGDSGEGKSWQGLAFQEILCELQGIDILQYLDVMNVYIPIEYGQKLDKLLFDKTYKPANILCVHEAREVVNAKDWHNFLTQAISSVNAMSRAIKRICFIIVSQFIRDITTDVRYTINYYCKVSRPIGNKARLYFYIMWKDDRDLDKPKLRKRKLKGMLEYPDGTRREYMPEYLELEKPSPEVIKKFEEADFSAKSDILRNKLNKLIQDMQSDMGLETIKINKMVDFYTETQDKLAMVGKFTRGKFRVRKEFAEMHQLNPRDLKGFQEKINMKLTAGGIHGELQQLQ